MPGVISGLASIVAVYVASEATYGASYYKIFPEAAPIDGSSQLRMFKFSITKKPILFERGEPWLRASIQAEKDLGGRRIIFEFQAWGEALGGVKVQTKF